ncbi:MAG: WxL domain-containing protein [Lactobacillaceae bacterium]|nr:WxL domain-containing protein [Lactobacillaceae bacterium]
MKTTKKKYLLVAAVALGVTVAGTTVANAEIGAALTGTTDVTLTGDASAITLDSVPNFAWGSMTTVNATKTNAVAGIGALQVTDMRGGSTGYSVTALASEMKHGEVVLPITAMTIDTTSADTNVLGATQADITSTNTIVRGKADSNGTMRIAETAGRLAVANSAKVGNYTGSIKYTLADALN